MSKRSSYQIAGEIFKEYKNRIYWLIFKVLRNEADAKDAFQNTFIKILENLENFKGKSKLSTWVYKIAYNEALMSLRQKYRQQHLASNFSAKKELLSLVNFPKPPDEELLKGELKERIDYAVKSLPLKYRMPVSLHTFLELAVNDAASILNLNLNSFKTRLHRAYLMIADEVNNYLKDKEQAVMPRKSCRLELSFIYNYSAGSLGNKEQKAFKAHIADCKDCRLFLNTYKKAINMTRSLQCPDIPPQLEKKVKSFLKKYNETSFVYKHQN